MSLELPAALEGFDLIASVSGGKDSTAMMLALLEASIPFRAVFADTQWEAPETYEYLDMLRERLCPIDVVGAEGGMVGRARTRAGFPSRMTRWCTRELKIDPIRKYHGRLIDETGHPTCSVVGVRAEESARRAALVELEDETRGPRPEHPWPVWRPLLAWSVDDVLAIHNRHGIPVNPLYTKGFSRVGCWPCIFSVKEELRLLADKAPERIDEISSLEEAMTEERARRNGETPGRYAHAKATYFQGREGSPLGTAPGIRTVIEWARTERGGRQLPMFDEAPRGGCYQWGLCEPEGTFTPEGEQ